MFQEPIATVLVKSENGTLTGPKSIDGCWLVSEVVAAVVEVDVEVELED